MNIHAQQNFGSYMNTIFFNVFSSNPDSSIHKFLNDFVPVLLHPPEISGKWTAYPPGDFILPIVISHSYFFQKHPFIDANIKQGEFKVYTDVYDNAVYHNAVGINDIQVILEFEKLDDAAKLFEKLRKDLIALCGDEIHSEDRGRRSSNFYSPETFYSVPSGVRIQLTTERCINSWYQVTISID